MCRKKVTLDWHHKLPKSMGGTDYFPEGNLAKVSKRQHAHYHALFGVKNPEQIVHYLNRKWIDPRFQLVVIPNPNYPKTQENVTT